MKVSQNWTEDFWKVKNFVDSIYDYDYGGVNERPSEGPFVNGGLRLSVILSFMITDKA